jgi:SAM-dependent methyltransferase
LRHTFETAAQVYDAARPDYPASLFDDLLQATGVQVGDPLLEIGCGTGKATKELAKRGHHVTCVELGEELGSVAARQLSAYPQVSVTTGDFDTWASTTEDLFRLVYAATSWHWLDPATRYAHAHRLLQPGGHLAFWSAAHVFPIDGDPFFGEIQEVYNEIGEGLPPGATQPRPGELPGSRAEIEGSGLFRLVFTRQYDWEVEYDAESYLRLLDTFSGHIAMAPWQRERLYGEIRRRLAKRADGRLRRHWGAVLHVAQRAG